MNPIQSLLDGVRVVDLSQNLAGPYATQILADMGADVIKVEPPGGDPARAWGPPFWDGDSPLFLCANRNKRSIILDLKDPSGRETVRRLIEGADVVVEAFRSGVAERLGVDYDAVRAINPRVVHASVTAFGTAGPIRDRPGYDPLLQAYAGLMSVTGAADGSAARVGTSVIDLGTGVWMALGVVAALWERERTGDGMRVTTSLLDTAVALMAYHIQGHLASGDVPGPMGTGLGMIAPYQAFAAADGDVMIAAGNDAIFRRLCVALDIPELADDPRFRTNADRVGNRDALCELLAVQIRALNATELVDRLSSDGVPCAPIQDVADVVHDRQVRESGMLRRSRRGDRGDYTDIAMPICWAGERPPLRQPPPAMGEHAHEVWKAPTRRAASQEPSPHAGPCGPSGASRPAGPTDRPTGASPRAGSGADG